MTYFQNKDRSNSITRTKSLSSNKKYTSNKGKKVAFSKEAEEENGLNYDSDEVD